MDAAIVTRPLTRYLHCIRFRELVLLQATPLFGVAFAAGEPPSIGGVFLFAVAGFLLLAHTFTFNDWAEFASDQNDEDKVLMFSRREASREELGILSLGLLLSALFLFSLLSLLTLILALALALLGIIYSHPATCAKGVPLLSSAVHLVAGVLHFLLGYTLYASIHGRGVLIGLFFALTFTAGHLNQEVRDYESDRRNAIRTNAATFSSRSVFLAGLGLFTLAYAHLVALALSGLIPPLIAWTGLLYPVHLACSVATLRAGLTFENVSAFRDRYRALYALIGLTILAALLLS